MKLKLASVMLFILAMALLSMVVVAMPTHGTGLGAHKDVAKTHDVPVPNCGAPGMPDCPPDCSDNCPWWNLWCMATCTNRAPVGHGHNK
jgi:hypothetical protein